MCLCVSLWECLCGYMGVCVWLVAARGQSYHYPILYFVQIRKICPLCWGRAASQAQSLAGRVGTGFQPPPAPSSGVLKKRTTWQGRGALWKAWESIQPLLSVQASSDRIQSENYPNQCSLMVSKCHDSREVNGSGYCTGSRGLL